MSKKPKKVKTPKAPKGRGSNGGGKDPVTGLTLTVPVDGIATTYESDKVYTKLAPITGTSDFNEISGEIELSDNAVIMTQRISGPSGDSASYSRIIFEGKFSYSKGRLNSARIEKSAGYHIWMGYGDPSGFAYIHDYILPRTGSGAIINSALWDEFYSGDPEVRTLANVNVGAAQDIGPIVGTIGTINNHYNGKVFNEGWWQDPFTPNLI